IFDQIKFLQAFAKCPGLGNLTNSNGQNGPDYLDLEIDGGFAITAGIFIFLSLRDFLKRRHEENE
ncbi:MAG: hypothetical protein OK457_12005, partial [Thaumarchaeota archaeon]|nr:hypothetical protein [Nitrososphaerota archaeon]